MLTLPSQLVARLLADPTFKPEQRPPRFELGAGAFVFRECAQPDGQPAKRRPPGSDRWRNTGGVKGARLLELESGSSVKLLRRYGTLQLATGAGVPARGRRAGASTAGKEGGKGKLRYHEYNLVDGRTGALDPSGVSNVTLYHVLPPRVEAAVLCGLPPGLTLTAKERRALDAVHSSATQKEREDRIKIIDKMKSLLLPWLPPKGLEWAHIHAAAPRLPANIEDLEALQKQLMELKSVPSSAADSSRTLSAAGIPLLAQLLDAAEAVAVTAKVTEDGRLAAQLSTTFADRAASAAVAVDSRAWDEISTDQLYKYLVDPAFNPGPRPALFEPTEQPPPWLFKEEVPSTASRAPRGARGLALRVDSTDEEKQRRRGVAEDRWKHSGGVKGSRDFVVEGEPYRLRRRYGMIYQPGYKQALFKYHQYTLVILDGKRDHTAPGVLFHVLPHKLPGKPTKPKVKSTKKEAKLVTATTERRPKLNKMSRKPQVRPRAKTERRARRQIKKPSAKQVRKRNRGVQDTSKQISKKSRSEQDFFDVTDSTLPPLPDTLPSLPLLEVSSEALLLAAESKHRVTTRSRSAPKPQARSSSRSFEFLVTASRQKSREEEEEKQKGKRAKKTETLESGLVMPVKRLVNGKAVQQSARGLPPPSPSVARVTARALSASMATHDAAVKAKVISGWKSGPAADSSRSAGSVSSAASATSDTEMRMTRSRSRSENQLSGNWMNLNLSLDCMNSVDLADLPQLRSFPGN